VFSSIKCDSSADLLTPIVVEFSRSAVGSSIAVVTTIDLKLIIK
jgi:hypothetical protein